MRKAYENFSNLSPSLLPEIGDTLPSPQQYGDRPKLTPHFDVPSKDHRANAGDGLNIGFQQKGRRTVMDIEECPIATKPINEELTRARADVKA